MHSLRPLRCWYRALVCAAGSPAAGCAGGGLTESATPWLTVTPNPAVVTAGDSLRLAVRLRDPAALRFLSVWESDADLLIVRNEVITARRAGRTTVALLVQTSAGDTNVYIPATVRGIRGVATRDTLRPGFYTDGSRYTPPLPTALEVVDTLPVSTAVQWSVADTSIAAVAPAADHPGVVPPPGAVFLYPRRVGCTNVTVRSAAVPSLAVTVPVVVWDRRPGWVQPTCAGR